MIKLLALIVTLSTLASCSAAGWRRMGDSITVGHGWTDSGRGSEWGAETDWVSVRPLAYWAEPTPVPAYIVDEPIDEEVGFTWPVSVTPAADHPHDEPMWWENELTVVGVAGAIATAVLGVWKREMIADKLWRKNGKNVA